MMTQEEFRKIALGDPNYRIAVGILETHGTNFTEYSCTKDILKRVIEDEDKAEIIGLIKEANLMGRDINEIIFMREEKNKDKKKLDKFFKAFENPETSFRFFYLMGETGVGKTHIAEHKYPNMPIIACNKGIDPYSLCYYLSDKDGKGLQPYETPFLQAVRNGTGIILDEMNELPQDTRMLIQGFTDEKKSIVMGDEVIDIKKGFKILGTMNPPSETDEREPLGDALLGRGVGYILRLTDEIIQERLLVSQEWLQSVRKLFNHCRQSGFIDVRELDYRDYQKFSQFDFETQLESKICQGDIKNIRDFVKVQATGEYQDLLRRVLQEMI